MNMMRSSAYNEVEISKDQAPSRWKNDHSSTFWIRAFKTSITNINNIGDNGSS
jgi:hypothetical protein